MVIIRVIIGIILHVNIPFARVVRELHPSSLSYRDHARETQDQLLGMDVRNRRYSWISLYDLFLHLVICMRRHSGIDECHPVFVLTVPVITLCLYLVIFLNNSIILSLWLSLMILDKHHLHFRTIFVVLEIWLSLLLVLALSVRMLTQINK